MRKFNFENLIYWQYRMIPCEKHEIEKIIIIYNIKNFSIEYFYNDNEKKNEFIINLLIEILKIDIWNMSYFDKIEFINSNLCYDNELELLDYDNSTLNHIDSKLINKELIQLNNKIIIYFNLNTKTEELVEHYLWSMSLVRFVTDIYEEDEFYMDKTIEKREKCHNYEELKKKLLNTHNLYLLSKIK